MRDEVDHPDSSDLRREDTRLGVFHHERPGQRVLGRRPAAAAMPSQGWAGGKRLAPNGTCFRAFQVASLSQSFTRKPNQILTLRYLQSKCIWVDSGGLAGFVDLPARSSKAPESAGG